MKDIKQIIFSHLNDECADKALVHITQVKLSERLNSQRENDRNGWHTSLCSDAELRGMLLRNLEQDDFLDVVALAAMLYVRNEMRE